MVFVAYSFLLTVRLHFTYSMLVMMTKPLVSERTTWESCPNVCKNQSIVYVDRRLDWTTHQQGAAMGAYFFGMLVSTFPGGVYSNRDYERSLMLVCVLVTAITLALVPVASLHYDSWMAVTVLRFLQGCAFGPTGACGGTLAGKILPKSKSHLYPTFMFSGTLFGGFAGHMFSGVVIPAVSHNGSFFILSIFGFVWTAVWMAMLHSTPYERAEEATSRHSMLLSSAPWSLYLQSSPFVSLLAASFGHGYLYSFITTGIPIYGAIVLGGDAIKNGINVSIPWLICWIISIVAGISASSLINSETIEKTTIRKVYAGIVLILSPLMLLGVKIAKCNETLARNFMRMAVILLGFERSSIRINSMDLCPRYAGSLIALCDVMFSIGNIIDSVIFRNLTIDKLSWNLSFLVSITLPITCSIIFILFGTTRQLCWDLRYRRSSITNISN